jgi:hypothetical protein
MMADHPVVSAAELRGAEQHDLPDIDGPTRPMQSHEVYSRSQPLQTPSLNDGPDWVDAQVERRD